MFNKKKNLAFALLLIAFLFTACGTEKPEDNPAAYYTLIGITTDKVSGKAISGIRMGYGSIESEQSNRGVSADTTNAEGTFSVTAKGSIFGSKYSVYVNDIDSVENGLYRDTVIVVNFKNGEKSGSSTAGDGGEYTVWLNIKLKSQ